MKRILLFFFLIPAYFLYSQEKSPEILTFEEYMGFVKKFHPVAGQADLQINMGEAELLRARGGFDPKIEVDYDRKEFRGTEYFDILNSTFKIPTWYGLEFKAGFEQNQGVFLNPERTVPEEGLFSAGVSLDIGNGMFIDQRMAALRSARIFREQSIAERDLMVNQILYEAALAYFDWLRMFNRTAIYEEFVENALERFQGVKRNAILGEVAVIDTVEAKITLQDRTLELEQARVEFMKERLNVSTFLWLENNIPVDLQPNIIPDPTLYEKVHLVLDIPQEAPVDLEFSEHPKLRSLEFKLQALEIDRRLKANQLLPEVNLEYNFITPDPEMLQNFNTSNYKAGVSFRFPLFLRKERGDLRLAEFKIEDATFDIEYNRRQIENKITALFQELNSYELQIELVNDMVDNYRRLLAAETRMMSFGESSLFLLNNRENSLIEARLKENELITKFLYTNARLFQNLGINPDIDQ